MTEIDLFAFETIPSQPSYECNRIGQIRKKGTTQLKSCYDNGNGYLQTGFKDKKRYIHRLIAETFLPNPDNLPEVDHINNVRYDNKCSNLRWVTKSENRFNRTFGNEVQSIPQGATRIDRIRNAEFEDLFYYNQCFYINFEFKIRCYQGTPCGKQKQWWLYDVNKNKVFFTTKQFLEYWPQFRNDFYPQDR